MKISHVNLEQCLVKPREWLSDRSRNTIFTFGYDRALLLAISYYHKTNSANQARRRLEEFIARHKFKNRTRVDEIQVNLDLYIRWYEESQTNTADRMVRILLDVGGYLQMSGIVSRIDITRNGYRGVLLGAKETGWKNQLRMPLIQKAIAVKYERPIVEVAIGVQSLDGSSLQTATYSLAQVKLAEREFINLGETIRDLSPRKRAT